jgi:small subunit ribosomal protein S2|tara:strand:+ start:1611 stop:2303 length:693 start_codon:yes stop_codon:yes gene_type:complete
MATVQLAQLLEAGVHFGHKANRWNPKMFPYIYSERDGIHILDLVQTSQLLNEASQFVNTAAQKDKIFLFVGTKRQAAAVIEQESKNCNSYYVNHRWLGGMLTNWKTVRTRIERLKKLEQQEQDGIFDLLPKKEVASTRKELEKLRMHLNGIKDMPRTPDVMIVVDQRRELTAIKEAISLNIPVISILDTNCDPDIVDIPIPGNDDSIGSIKLILKTLGSNILSGQNQNID